MKNSAWQAAVVCKKASLLSLSSRQLIYTAAATAAAVATARPQLIQEMINCIFRNTSKFIIPRGD